MFPIPDTLSAIYLGCFAFGLVFVVASLLLGLGHDALHLPGFGGDGGGADHGGGLEVGGHDVGGADNAPADGSSGGASSGHNGAHHSGGHGVSPINMSTILAFVTWFGGAGYVLRVYGGITGALSLVGAGLAGLVGGAIIFYFLARVLLPNQRFLDPADFQMEGTVARVTVPISADRVGEIVYTKGDSRRSDGARSVDGSTIDHGTEVVVVRYERGIAYVEPWASFVARG